MRDFLAFVGAMYGAAVGIGSSLAALAGSEFDFPLRFGMSGTTGLALMGVGIASYGILKFDRAGNR